MPTLFAEEQHSQAKALFLFNFANFVRWPKQAFTQNHDKLKMCIFGDANLGSFLDQVDGTRIRDKRLLVIKTNVLDDIKKGCHILFVSQNKQDLLPTLFNSVQHIYVLSVSDVEGFARNGGVISIVRTFDKLTFEINLDVALKNGLLINSDLLSLARIIGRDGKPVKKENLGPEDTLLRPQMAK
ncbi:MAG: YfiR family protein [Pseudomonadales bacterium]|nr:YfiR family protein [Pseudomonadales bacterium]